MLVISSGIKVERIGNLTIVDYEEKPQEDGCTLFATFLVGVTLGFMLGMLAVCVL